MKKTYIIIVIVAVVIAGFGAAWKLIKKEAPLIVTNFEECVAAGNPVMESYPRQCRHKDQLFTEVIGQSKACTQEAKLRPDGSYVGRTGQNCEFAQCPAEYLQTVTECKKDSDCPSSQYACQAIQGTGTACPSTDPSCVPTYTVIQGECKLKEGNQCGADSDCVAGNLCFKNTCTSPIGEQCSGSNDTSCPADFECAQECGPPVVRYPDDTPLKYFCQLKGYIRICPICLAKNTLIDTPQGAILVQDIQKGTQVWTVTASGQRVIGVVIETSKVAVLSDHKMVRLILDDGRALSVSPGHQLIDGRRAGDIVAGDLYDGARVVSSDRVFYGEGATYDILSSGETGFYFANGILLDSTLQDKGHKNTSDIEVLFARFLEMIGR